MEAVTSLHGPTHPFTLASKGNLAQSLKDQGRGEEARRLLQETIAQKAQVQGEAHPDTLREQVNLAITLKQSGQLHEAAALLEQTIAAMERCLDPKNMDVLHAKGEYASVLAGLGELDRAISLQEQVVADFSATLGPSHRMTLFFEAHLANYSLHMEQLYGLAKHIAEERYGTLHDDADISSKWLARLREIFHKQREQLGPTHEETLHTKKYLEVWKTLGVV